MNELFVVDTRGKSFTKLKEELGEGRLAEPASIPWLEDLTKETVPSLLVRKSFRAILADETVVELSEIDELVCFPKGWFSRKSYFIPEKTFVVGHTQHHW